MGDLRLYASPRKPHYRDHLQPIWDLIPNDIKVGDRSWNPHQTLLVAGYGDIKHGYPYIYVEHGAGQSYQGWSAAGYSGGSGYDACRLFICPNHRVVDRWRERYPDTPAVAVGSPRLDRYHIGYHTPSPRTIAITFHWNCSNVPETQSAWPHYDEGLEAMVYWYRAQGWTVLGHEHPRWRGQLKRRWLELGVDWTDDPLRDASALAADNTSMMAEFLSCGRPVIALNAPWYRKDVTHGDRFWDWDLNHVESAAEASLIDLDALPLPRGHPYAYNDGQAALRASQAIVDLMR